MKNKTHCEECNVLFTNKNKSLTKKNYTLCDDCKQPYTASYRLDNETQDILNEMARDYYNNNSFV